MNLISIYCATLVTLVTTPAFAQNALSCIYVQDDRIVQVPIGNPVQVCFGSPDFMLLIKDLSFAKTQGWRINVINANSFMVHANVTATTQAKAVIEFPTGEPKSYKLSSGKQVLGRRKINLLFRPVKKSD